MARFKKKKPLERPAAPYTARRSSSLIDKHLATLRFVACGAKPNSPVLLARAPYIAVDIQVEANLRRAFT
jgi:hypothetical protein